MHEIQKCVTIKVHSANLKNMYVWKVHFVTCDFIYKLKIKRKWEDPRHFPRLSPTFQISSIVPIEM